MITKDDLEVGTELVSETGAYKCTVIDWAVNKNMFFFEDKEGSTSHCSVRELNISGMKIKPTEEWVDCPIIDISFSTKDRVECRVRDDSFEDWKIDKLVFVRESDEDYTTEETVWMQCQIKKSDLDKFKV